jgi:hypothetical protein
MDFLKGILGTVIIALVVTIAYDYFKNKSKTV